jgi:DNA alkylation damage repair protein AlkB
MQRPTVRPTRPRNQRATPSQTSSARSSSSTTKTTTTSIDNSKSTTTTNGSHESVGPKSTPPPSTTKKPSAWRTLATQQPLSSSSLGDKVSRDTSEHEDNTTTRVAKTLTVAREKGAFQYCPSSSQGSASNARSTEPVVLQDGLVLLPKWLSIKQQKYLEYQCYKMGSSGRKIKLGPSVPKDKDSSLERDVENLNLMNENLNENENDDDGVFGGFYRPFATADYTAKMNLKMMCVGKHWNPIKRVYEDQRSDFDNAPVPPMPQAFSELCLKALADAQKYSSSIPDMDPTACIINLYPPETGKLGWHQDKTENEQKRLAGVPVVSFSVGDTGIFKFYDFERKQQTLELESGDVLVFGGPSRMIMHTMAQILPNTRPPQLKRPGRLNLTFRDY